MTDTFEELDKEFENCFSLLEQFTNTGYYHVKGGLLLVYNSETYTAIFNSLTKIRQTVDQILDAME